MRKPAELAYGLDDHPPAKVVVATALQQATVVLIWVFPTILLARELRASPADAAALISMSFIACGLGVIVQATRWSGLGCGLLAPVSMSSPHILPSLLAARAGGLPMVAGMTILSGLMTIVLAQGLTRIRNLIPPEIAGAVVLIIGLAICITGAQTLLVAEGGAPPTLEQLAVALLTIAVAIGLSVWGRGVLRWACMLFAMTTGCVAAWLLGVLEVTQEFRDSWLPVVALPRFVGGGYAFEPALLPAYLVASIASTLKTAGIVTTLQKLNDADWIRPNQKQIVGAVTGDGVGTMLAGLAGTSAVNVSATNAAIQHATGVTSRVIAYATGAACIALACFPAAAATASQMPAPVIAATLLYAGALMTAGGIQLAASRLLDTRRSLAIGLAIAAALAVESVPALVGWLPPELRPLMTATGFGTMVALLLNAVLRFGVRRDVTLTAPHAAIPSSEVDDFVTRAGMAWGARREVVSRVAHLAASCMDALATSGVVAGDARLRLTLDEAVITLRIAYEGPALVLAQAPPTPEEMLEDENAPARLAGFMVRRLSDRLRVREKGGTVELVLSVDQ
ncbi:solute carrier family 23 protein [Falsiroseomonas sp. HW251]|uniref:solute carrier family 23 protein n=1 Tax=Falsiroseomonas sp. HW251 TaxID=3390998 RepID=UPI003D31FBC0